MDKEARPLLPKSTDVVACCVRFERLCLVVVPICVAVSIIGGVSVLLILFGPRPQ